VKVDPKKFKLTFDVIREDEYGDEEEEAFPVEQQGDLPDGCRITARFS